MRSRTKKFLVWVGITIFSLVISFIGLLSWALYCERRNDITVFSPCYFCVSSKIRNFPVTNAEEGPIYGESFEYADGNTIPAMSYVEFTTKNSLKEVIQESTAYLTSIGYRKERLGCENRPECPNCCINFVGKDSEVYISIHLETALNSDTPRETNRIWVNETFNVER